MKSGRLGTAVLIVGVLSVAVSLVVFSVPLYSMFCKVTGYAGTPRKVAGGSMETTGQLVTVRFDSSVMHGMPWKFAPDQISLQVHLGETTLATFTAENPTSEQITGTASFNVTPAKAGPYVDKIACFCFSEQTLEAGQKVVMPVSFFIDPKIAEDPNTSDIKTITLSYTFFKSRQQGTVVAGALERREGKQ